MYQKVKIGSQEVEMLSLASVDVYYLHVFHEDPIKIQAKKDFSEGDLFDLVSKMGFIMAKYAETKDRKSMLKLNEDMYLDWLEQFERADYLAALPDIRATYEGQSITHASEKKSEDELTEK